MKTIVHVQYIIYAGNCKIQMAGTPHRLPDIHIKHSHYNIIYGFAIIINSINMFIQV